MKLILLTCLLAFAAADVSHILEKDKLSEILKQSQVTDPDGSYDWQYETQNGIQAQASGALVNQNSEDVAIAVSGSYLYTAPNGEHVQISYVADANGYQPQGDVLPMPPPIPPQIVRALEYIRDHPPKETK